MNYNLSSKSYDRISNNHNVTSIANFGRNLDRTIKDAINYLKKTSITNEIMRIIITIVFLSLTVGAIISQVYFLNKIIQTSTFYNQTKQFDISSISPDLLVAILSLFGTTLAELLVIPKIIVQNLFSKNENKDYIELIKTLDV